MSSPRRGILAALFLAAACSVMPSGAQTLKIQPMGDSITNGAGGTSGFGGYRGTLYTLLTNAGHTVDFVGTVTTNSASLVDMDHNGHGGWQIHQLDANVEAWFNAIDDPDIILLHIGTNDFGAGNDTVNAINRLDALLTKIAGLRPAVHVIVTNLMERGEPQNTAIQTEFNPFVEGVVNSHIASGHLVSFLDMRALVPLSDMPDNLHPNQAGYDKMAAGWVTAIEAVLDPGDGVPPSMTGAFGSGGDTEVLINFNKKLDQATAETAGNYAIDNGLSVSSAQLSVNQRSVTLTTSPQVAATTYTVTVNNVQDQVIPTPNTIAANSTVQFLAETQRGFFNNVPEAECYTLVYSLDIPNTANYSSNPPAYGIDYSDRIGQFDRIAYYLELQTSGGDLQYAWASMDAFTSDVGQIGVPTTASGAVFQQIVNNMNVVSNVPGVTTGESLDGNIEFWPTNYSAPNEIGIPGASGSTFDFGDTKSAGGGYGSMQVHNHGDAHTVLAFNRWGGNAGTAEVGIGNNPAPVSGGVDWTFAQNAAGFEIKTLQVLVRTVGDTTAPTLASARAGFDNKSITVTFSEPIRRDTLLATNFSLDNGVSVLSVTVGDDLRTVLLNTSTQPGAALTLTADNLRDSSANANEILPASTIAVAAAALPAEILANVGAAADNYELVYSLDIPVTGNFNAPGGPAYSVDNSAKPGLFSRIAYYLELETGGTTEYIWTSMDAFTDDKGQIGIPTAASGAIFQQTVANLEVISNNTGITTGTGIATGNIEFWAGSYNGTNAANVPNASGAYDWGDNRTSTQGYGCMQVHNHDIGGSQGQTLFALNRFGNDGSPLCLGIGNDPNVGNGTDWTFEDNAGSYTKRTLHVMVLPAPYPTTLPAEVTTNIGAAAIGYELIYSIDLPATGNFNAPGGPAYSVDNSAMTGSFSRIAYYLELDSEYIWTSMDAFTGDRSKIGIPTVATGAAFQQYVSNLDIITNKAGVTTGTGLATGNIEFWPYNYSTANAAGIPGASDSTYDFGDVINGATAGYGSMQIHNHGAGETLFAMNRFGTDGNPLCLGIGNRPTSHPDWTFANNAGIDYTTRTLHVMVLPSTFPAEITANVPESTNYELVYTLDIPANGNLAGPGTGAGFTDYSLNNGGPGTAFNRVAYYMELQKTGDPQPTFVWVSMDAFTQDRTKIGVPTVGSGAFWQQLVSNMNVVSNSPNVTNGTGIATGNIEFWPGNYNGSNAIGIPGASGSQFDFGDGGASGSFGHGSMQVHNHGAQETLFAINKWGNNNNTTNTLSVGIGNENPPGTGNTDWTFAYNADQYDLVRRLHVLVLPAPGAPVLVGAAGSTTLDRLVVTFDREVADTSAVPGNFALDGGATVTGATLLAGNTKVALDTSAQTPGQTYNVSVTGVQDQSGGSFILPGASAQFTAYAPPAILANVPDAGMELIYCLDIPAAKPRWNFNPVTYGVDEAQYGEILFDRVGYLMELDGDWVYASFDPHTSQIAQTGVPTLNVTGSAFQQIVTNMNVASNVPAIFTGNGITTGNIEFWGGNYSPANGIGIPNADGGTFDFGDSMSNGGHGSMQIHNHGASQTLFSYSNWGANSGGNSDLGIGNRGSSHPDWTNAVNAGDYTVRNLYVLARPGGTASGDAPEILTHPCDRVVAAGSDVTFAVSVLGDGPFTYQWRCNGIPIQGETNSWLTLTSVSAVDIAPYDVVVSGPDLASTTSFAADLTLTSGPPSFLVNWRLAYGFHPSDGSTTGQGDLEDKEGDLRSNILEAAFGTDPNVVDSGSLSVDEGAGTFTAGDPIIHVRWSPFALTMRYVRLVDHAAAGLVYSPEYLHDGSFIEDPADPVATRVQIPDGGGGMMDLPVRNIGGFDYEVVEEPFFLFDGNGMKADSQIGRVRIDLN